MKNRRIFAKFIAVMLAVCTLSACVAILSSCNKDEAKANGYVVTTRGEVVITDGDDMIRNIDFAVDIVNQTKFGKKVAELVGKADQFYKKFKSKFNISD